jgi:predicted peptidase
VGRQRRFKVKTNYCEDQMMQANPGRCSLSLLLFGVAMALQPAASVAQEKKNAQQAKSFEKEITIKVTLNYLLFLPEGYESSEKKWPLILFLHGAGESGNDIEKVKATGLPKLLETKTDMPFVVVSPQSPRGGWNADSLNALLDDVIAKYKIDVDRVYLTGLSMGGFGTWELGTAHPERFAALAPICGGGNPARASRLKGVPVWAFHGAKDNVVPIARTEAMIKAMKEAGMEPKFTIYPDARHDSWTETYNNPELYKWFLEHKRAKTQKD